MSGERSGVLNGACTGVSSPPNAAELGVAAPSGAGCANLGGCSGVRGELRRCAGLAADAAAAESP